MAEAPAASLLMERIIPVYSAQTLFLYFELWRQYGGQLYSGLVLVQILHGSPEADNSTLFILFSLPLPLHMPH